MSVVKPALQHPDLIAYLLGANNYSWVYFRNGEKKLLAKSIGYLEKELSHFVRVHKTVLVNPAFVKALHQPPRQKMAGEIQLMNDEVFPVSRRRWEQVNEALQYFMALVRSEATTASEAASATPKTDQSKEVPVQSIFLVTDDESNALQSKHMIERNWPAYQCHVSKRSAQLPELLKPLPRHNYPILLLLDARTTSLERLHTLRCLKEDPQLSHIPVILLTSPTDQSVAEGYKQKANSVISMPNGYVSFSKTVERVCQFWLHMAALPGVSR